MYKETKDNEYYIKFDHFRKKCKDLAKNNYKKYIHEVECKLNKESKHFWIYIDNKKKIKNTQN